MIRRLRNPIEYRRGQEHAMMEMRTRTTGRSDQDKMFQDQSETLYDSWLSGWSDAIMISDEYLRLGYFPC